MMRTHSGKRVYPLDMEMRDVDINDIAHALALCNRFAGHTKAPISVAQHSVYVSRLMLKKEGGVAALQGLLHDASEAYLGDMVKWIKDTHTMKPFKDAETALQTVIYKTFSVPTEPFASLEWADKVMVRFESVMGYGYDVIQHPDYPPLTDSEIAAVQPWEFIDWPQAETAFLEQFQALYPSWR